MGPIRLCDSVVEVVHEAGKGELLLGDQSARNVTSFAEGRRFEDAELLGVPNRTAIVARMGFTDVDDVERSEVLVLLVESLDRPDRVEKGGSRVATKDQDYRFLVPDPLEFNCFLPVESSNLEVGSEGPLFRGVVWRQPTTPLPSVRPASLVFFVLRIWVCSEGRTRGQKAHEREGEKRQPKSCFHRAHLRSFDD